VEWIGGALLLASALIYGNPRATEFPAGPRSLIRGLHVVLKHDGRSWRNLPTHEALTAQAVRHQPDLIIWPETMFRWGIRPPIPTVRRRAGSAAPEPRRGRLAGEAESGQADPLANRRGRLIIGADALDASAGKIAHYNSAVFVEHDASSLAGRYDKVHRVPFGEYIPLADTFTGLQRLFPFAGAMGISAGEKFHVFHSGGHRLVPTICFEDTVPHLVRNMVAAAEQEQQVDCLVNLTNDGWFHGSSELDQHLVTSAFRCVETRTPLVRAVNTGISAFIDGNGVIREPEVFIDFDGERNDARELRSGMRDASGRFHKQLNAALVSHVPLDPRRSLYVAWGDWFAALCGAACGRCWCTIATRFMSGAGCERFA
jgi:apolipoprotein N-acyltransferase